MLRLSEQLDSVTEAVVFCLVGSAGICCFLHFKAVSYAAFQSVR